MYHVIQKIWKPLSACLRPITKSLRRGFSLLSTSQINVATNDGGVTQGDDMSKEQVVSDGVAAIQQAIVDRLGAAYDSGLAEAPVGGGDPSKIFSQEEFDAKLAESLAADALIDAEEIAAARAELQLQIDGVNASLVEMTAKYETEHGALQGFKDKVEGLQGALDVLKGLLLPAPQPEPVPEPVPEPAPEA